MILQFIMPFLVNGSLQAELSGYLGEATDRGPVLSVLYAELDETDRAHW